MTENAELKLDRALEALAREVADNTPRPGPDLLARVLADAAAVHPPQADEPVRTQAVRTGWRTMLFGWTSGAVAAMALALIVGMGVGMEMEPADLPFATDELVVMADGGLLPEEIL